MATLTLVYPGSPGQLRNTADGPHRRVTLSSTAGVTTLTFTDSEVAHESLGRRWVEVPRPGYRPFLHDSGPGNRKWTLKATLYAEPPGNVSADLDTIIFGHALAAEVTVAYGRLEATVAVITDLKVTTKERVDGSSEPYWVELSIELTDKPPDLRQIVAPPAPSAAPAPPPPSSPPAGQAGGRWYVVQRGDTLSRIAQKMYGHVDRWPAIAADNHLRNPNVIAVGQRLHIP